MLNNPVEPGDELIVQVVRDVYRICLGKTDRFILAIDPKTGAESLVYNDTVSAIPAPLGINLAIKVKVPTPNGIECGHYVYRATTRADCDGKIFVQEIPAAPFQVCR